MLFQRLLRLVLAACVAVSATQAGRSGSRDGRDHVQFQIRDGAIASRAVNLGGWLVAEYWMSFTSAVWTDVPENSRWDGEYVAMKHLGKAKGDAAFEQHWATWITETDIAEIAKTGAINTLRVSTGFWIINDEDDSDQSAIARAYASGGLKYLDKLINEWGAKYNLAVMVSLHAHKGSQNGYDHSAPLVKGNATWSDDPTNVQSSLNYATFIAHRYKDSPAFLGLNLMNEPAWPTSYDLLKQYYTDAYNAIRADGNECIIATSPWLTEQRPGVMDDFMPCPAFVNVWHEFHVYYKWGWEGVPKRDVFQHAANYSNSHFAEWRGNAPFLGEWSLATTDEVPLSPTEMTALWDVMLNEAESAAAGWAFWAWRHDEETQKTPSAWSLRQLLKLGTVKLPTDVAVRAKADDSSCAKRINPNWKPTVLPAVVDDGSGTPDRGSGASVVEPPTRKETVPASAAARLPRRATKLLLAFLVGPGTLAVL